jgi:LysM repeat protein
MTNPNPFIPQGSVLEQNKRRSRMKLAVFCVLAVSVCGLTAMLVQGCKKEQENPVPPVEPTTSETYTNLQPAVTNLAPVVTNVEPVAPVTPVVVPVPEVPSGSEYTVIKGDTLAKIAKAHGVKLKALQDANPGVVPTKLKVGQKLTLPAGGVAAPAAIGTSAGSDMTAGATGSGEPYAVKSGDTLAKIAKNHGVTLKALRAANPKFASTDRIHVGDKLTIPAKAEAVAPAPAPAPAPVAAPAPVTPAVEPVATPAPAGTPAGR